MRKGSDSSIEIVFRFNVLKICGAMISLVLVAAASAKTIDGNDQIPLTAYVPVGLQVPARPGSEAQPFLIVGSFQTSSACDDCVVVDRKVDRPHPQVQGSELLEKFRSPSSAVVAKGGSRVFLWSKMLVAEDPDFDPLQHLDGISVEWTQVAGPQVKIEEMGARSASFTLPAVTILTRIELLCTISNSQGSRRLTLKIDVIP